MISDQKHKCEKGAKFGTNGFADKRVEIYTGTKFHSSCLNHSHRNVQRSSIDLKENLLCSLILNLTYNLVSFISNEIVCSLK